MKTLLLAASLAAAPLAAHNGVPHDQGLSPATIGQLHAVAEAIEPYHDFRVAEREGWKKFGGDEPLMGEHWHHPDGPDYVGSDARLDFRRPSNLMYTMIDGKRTLTGVTFNVRLRDGEAMPEGFAGRADRWHAHDMLRAIEAALQDRPILKWLANGWIDANYRNKGDDRGRIAMIHVWLGIENPDGVFADHNRIVPYLKMGLPAAHAAGASMAAAHGIDMATPNGCKELIDGRLWIANAPARTARALHATCRTEADRIRAALRLPPAELNRVAAAAAQRWNAAWASALTPTQRARIAAMTEHGSRTHGAGEHAHH
jgi:hypothetical protein